MNESPLYVKRLRFRADLAAGPSFPDLPGVTFTPFTPGLLADHALALCASFRDGPETVTFPSLGAETGCRDLLHALVSLPTFLPPATWLATAGPEPVGTIQCTAHEGEAEIHNLGVVPGLRRRGLGAALLALCLASLAELSCRSVSLEVTASNDAALRLYRKFGFRPYKTVYLRAYGSVPSPGQDI